MNKLALVFDLDGTLVNSLGDICGHLNHVRRDYGLEEKPISELAPKIGYGINYLARQANLELPEEEVPRIVEKFRAYYIDNPHISGEAYPGVLDTLEKLQGLSHVSLAVLTNKLSLAAERTLAYYLPTIKFSLIAGPDRVGAKKPDSAGLTEVLKIIACPPEQAWYVGDHNVDRDCAQGAGVRFLGAGYGFGGVEVEEASCLHSFPELLGKIGLAI